MARGRPAKKRYTEEEKQQIIDFVKAAGRGGAKKAKEQFGVSVVSLQNWMKAKGEASPRGRGRKKGSAASSIDATKMTKIKEVVAEIIKAEEHLETLKGKLSKLL